MPARVFHPAVQQWFAGAFEQPTPPQREVWPALHAGGHALIAAPTGSGKTLAAFMAALDSLVRESLAGTLPDETRVVYVSPLKALSHDIELNLNRPLEGIAEAARERGDGELSVRTWLRTSDTTQSSRTRAAKRPPHIVVTTPESLYILLTSESGRRMLATTRTVIVDEIHALLRDKRGSHLALSLERLEALVAERGGEPLQRIGLSATQKPIETVTRWLLGARDEACTVVDAGHKRALDLALCVPGSPLEAVMAHEVWEEVFGQLARLADDHRTTLVFVNTRSLAERVARQLSELLGEPRVAAHHGSLARERRLDAERRLRAGELSVLVATASLELGIDIGDVDLVCQLGSPRSIATFLQRVGRSGHALGRTPKGRLFPLTRDDLVECAALLDAVRAGELDRLRVPEAPLDVLAQQIVAETAGQPWSSDALYDAFTRAGPYRQLSRSHFDQVVRMLAEGFSTRRGRRAALIHHDAVQGTLRGRRSARIAAMTSGGAIPDTFDYEVQLEPNGDRVGTVHEDFAVESMAGDVFQLGNTSYRILRVEPGVVRVADARGAPPSIPFWLGEAPGRTAELSEQLSALRQRVQDWIEAGEDVAARAAQDLDVCPAAAQQLSDYLTAGHAALGALPTRRRLILERFFDETGSMHIVLHSPHGARVNRAFGLALRKRFCRSFNVELQAAADDDAIVLSLGPMHSFVLEDVFRFLRPHNVRDVLVQALLPAPMFEVRWRHNASRSLAVLRFSGGKKVPPRFQRMLADDLLAVSFPDQVACAENLTGGDIEVPDHPLVRQTVHDCLTEAMDVDGLEQLLTHMAAGEVECVARDLSEPSPLAQEILSARPYAFLDDAPLEERRTQAVMQRRWLDPKSAADLGALDTAAIDHVVAEARPDPRDVDELHDALVVHAALLDRELQDSWRGWLRTLCEAGRATAVKTGAATLWVPAERVVLFEQAYGAAALEPPLQPPPGYAQRPADRAAALREIVAGRLELLGPVTVADLTSPLGLSEADVVAALAALEADGFVLRGRFDTRLKTEQWCERRLLARVHRRTLERLRKEIEPVSAATYVRFLCDHQRLSVEHRAQGPEGLYDVVRQLGGFEAPAAAWERDLLAARVADYDPGWLDQLCWSGRVAWGRSQRSVVERRQVSPVRATPIVLSPRAELGDWLAPAERAAVRVVSLGSEAERVLSALEGGALFFADLVSRTGLIASQVERGLAELVARGRVTADGFAGLRALIAPAERRRGGRSLRRAGGPPSLQSAGRWTSVPLEHQADLERVARALLQRWGVVFRRVLDREGRAWPWRDLIRIYRRLEARGEIRGGRFVAGFSGEQFALPEAVTALRKLRRKPTTGEWISLSASDPLNLTGGVLPQARVAAVGRSRILLRDGQLVAHVEGGKVCWATEVAEDERWQAERRLTQRSVDARLRAYLGNAG